MPPVLAAAAASAATAPDAAEPADLYDREEARRPSPLQWFALACIAGVALGRVGGSVTLWCGAGALTALAAACLPRWISRNRARRGVLALTAALSAFACAAAGWTSVRLHHVAPDNVLAMVRDEPVIVRLAGMVDTTPRLVSARQGALGAFRHQSPGTLFGLRVTGVWIDGQWRSASGRVQARIDEADALIAQGTRIEADGWLSAFTGPTNPGQFDYRPILARQGYAARLTLPSPANWRAAPATARPGAVGRFAGQLRRSAESQAYAALHAGVDRDGPAVQLLDALLLGIRSPDMHDLNEDFRRVGLAHMLAISGAHLAIMTGLVWGLLRLLVPRPPRAAAIVLVVLALYLLAVPPRVPILRAGIMAAAYCGAFMIGRRWRALDPLALALIVVLLWRPQDIVDGGMQLSFGIVAGLIFFVPRIYKAIVDSSAFIAASDPTRRWLFHFFGGYIIIQFVAFSLALPLAAYHFQIICPLTIPLVILGLPVITLLLGLGYLKIALGLLSPTLGSLLAGPLLWIADTLAGLVGHAARWPGVMIDLAQPVSPWWAAVTAAVVVVVLAGPLWRRPKLAAGLVIACAAWLAAGQRPPASLLNTAASRDVPLRLHMLDVGDGSCYLLRLAADPSQPPAHVLFDCGSHNIPDVAGHVILPVLRRLGVRQLDAVVISHGDFDHFCGLIDLADALRIEAVWLPPQFRADAVANPADPPAALIEALHQRAIPIRTVTRGHESALGGVKLECLWPPPNWPAEQRNDSSVVLRFTTAAAEAGGAGAAGRRVLLSGDIQTRGIDALLALEPNLRADVADLPHHGSFVAASPRWLEAVRPDVALQSTRPFRMIRDRWGPLLDALDTERFSTATHGLVEVSIRRDGTIQAAGYLPAPTAAGPARR